MHVLLYVRARKARRWAGQPGTLVAFANPVGWANKLSPAKAELKEQDSLVDVRAAE